MQQETRKNQQVAIVDSTIETPRATRQQQEMFTIREEIRHVLLVFMGAGFSLSMIIGLVAGLIGAWGSYTETWTLALTWGVPIAFIAALVYAGARGFLWYRHQQEALEGVRSERARLNAAANAENELKYAAADEMRARAKQLYFSLPVDERGNALFHDPSSNMLAPFMLNYQEHPNLSSMHYSIKQDAALGQEKALPAGATSVNKPQIAALVKLVERNSLQLPLGASLKNQGETTIVDVSDSHIKIIGSSRKGKSCLAAAIIDIMTQTHDADTFRVALLDLENKTSKLFEGMAHLAVLDLGGNRVSLHARNPKQVADYLHLIRDLMDYRYTLPEEEQEVQCHILAYVEEFLSLKRHKDLDERARARMIDDLNELAVRGLKAHIHMLCCAQVDYADDDLRAFANNFGLNISFSVRPEAARAAGFVCNDLLAENYARKIPGQCVVEGTGCNDLVDAPDYDVKAKLKELRSPNQGTELSEERETNAARTQVGTQIESASQASLQDKMIQVLEALGSGINTKDALIEQVWRAKKGKGQNYQEACHQYEQVMMLIAARAKGA